MAYSEFVFTDTLWPDYSEEDLLANIYTFQTRDRRFGGLKEEKNKDETESYYSSHSIADFIPLLVVGGNLFSILVVAMGLVGMSEFLTMKRKLLISPEAIVAFMAVACLLVPSNWINFFQMEFL